MKKVLGVLFAAMVVFSLTMPEYANGHGGDQTSKPTSKGKKTKSTRKTRKTDKRNQS